jgi:hypothetical protein
MDDFTSNFVRRRPPVAATIARTNRARCRSRSSAISRSSGDGRDRERFRRALPSSMFAVQRCGRTAPHVVSCYSPERRGLRDLARGSPFQSLSVVSRVPHAFNHSDKETDKKAHDSSHGGRENRRAVHHEDCGNSQTFFARRQRLFSIGFDVECDEEYRRRSQEQATNRNCHPIQNGHDVPYASGSWWPNYGNSEASGTSVVVSRAIQPPFPG